MNIILATPVYPPEAGGPATYTAELAMRLKYEHEIVVAAYADDAQAIPGTTLTVVSKKQGLFLRLWQFYWALVREAKKADLIYVQNAVAAGLPAVLAGKKARKPVILKFVGDEAWERATQAGRTTKQLENFYMRPEGGLRTTAFMAVQRYVLRRATIVTTPSAYLADLLVKYYGVDKNRVVVNYNAIDDSPLTPAQRKPHQIMVGARLTVWKNVAGIIRATAILKEKFSDVTCVVAGDGPERKNLEGLARDVGVGGHVIFTGRASKERTREIQQESAVQVLNSSYEGMPHSVLESYAVGTPIVATNIPGTSEAVVDGETGLLVPTGDDKALAFAIGRLLTDPVLREKLAAGGSKILREKFSWVIHLRRLNEMFVAAITQ